MAGDYWNVWKLIETTGIAVNGCKWLTVVLARLFGQFVLILWGKTSDSAHFFLVRATENTKTVLDQILPHTNYDANHTNLKIYQKYNKIHSIVFPLSVSKPFSLSM